MTVYVPVKVTAYVESGIKDLVELLNTFDGIQTVECCEGGEEGKAYVQIDCGIDHDTLEHNLHEVVDIAQLFADAFDNHKHKYAGISDIQLFRIRHGEINISISWLANYHPVIVIEFSLLYMKEIITILASLRDGNRDTRISKTGGHKSGKVLRNRNLAPYVFGSSMAGGDDD